MKRYQFSLERLLNIRKYRELEWELRLTTATGRCVELQNELERLAGQRRETLASRFALSAGSASYLLSSEMYLRRIAETSRRTTEVLREREHERDEVRVRYVEASRDRKVLDKLKERRSEAHYRRSLAEEVKTIDDLTNATAAQTRYGQ